MPFKLLQVILGQLSLLLQSLSLDLVPHTGHTWISHTESPVCIAWTWLR
jgi:hypothetical protein